MSNTNIKKLNEEISKVINEDEAFEQSVLEAFDFVRGWIETSMKNIKLESELENFDRISRAIAYLKTATHAYQNYKRTNDEHALKFCYDAIEVAKEQFN